MAYNLQDDYPDDFYDFDGEPCSTCDGTGEVCCSACEGSGCSRCSDGMRTCEDCDGSGFRPVEPDGDEDI
jgi:hypothetical protein